MQTPHWEIRALITYWPSCVLGPLTRSVSEAPSTKRLAIQTSLTVRVSVGQYVIQTGNTRKNLDESRYKEPYILFVAFEDGLPNDGLRPFEIARRAIFEQTIQVDAESVAEETLQENDCGGLGRA